MGPARIFRLGLSLAVMLLCLRAAPLRAVDELTLALGDLQGPGWSLRDGQLRLYWDGNASLKAELHAARLSLPASLGEVHELHLRCNDLRQDGARLRCRQGRLNADSSWLGILEAGARWELDRSTGDLDLQLTDVQSPHGTLGLDLQLRQTRWQAALKVDRFAVAALASLATPWYVLEPAWDSRGHVRGTVDLRGAGSAPAAVTLDLRLEGFGFANTEGTQAGEALQGRLQVQASPTAAGWQGRLQLQVEQGQLYSDPMYLEFTPAAPVKLQATLSMGSGTLALSDVHWRHPGALVATGSARLSLGDAIRLEQLQLEVEQAHFPAAFTTYLQPWLVDSTFANLHTTGTLQGQLGYGADQGVAQVELQLQDVNLDDPRGRLKLEGLSGQLDWAADEQLRRQRLHWDGGHLYRVALGGADVELLTVGRQVSLAQPAQLPVLDGRLIVDSFNLHYGDALEWSLDAALTPVSMPALTGALGWPEMSGTLSGMIPGVQYRDGDLELGGTLLVGAFDGDITVRNLRMEKPLGAVPRLWADVNIRQVDLETLTRTFAFGKIEGRLNGAVTGLYLEAWRPVAFDAWFATPEDDRSRHRISQRAVDNLTNIGGGGMSGALSRGFLRFLEDFPYQAIGLRCRLENGVCHMSGVAPAERGYYLVKGRTIPPRIDIIGYEERVDWEALLERLQSITAEQGPVVQ